MVVVHELNQPSSDDALIGLILPGAGYTAQAPLLYWAGEALVQSGWHTYAVEWSVDSRARTRPQEFVEEALDRVLRGLPGPPRLVVAKSLGSFALPYIVGTAISGVWLTPILTNLVISAALKGASSNHLAIGGTSDPAWAPEKVAGTKARMVSVEGADHSLHMVGEPWSSSLRRQESVVNLLAQHAGAAAGATGQTS